MVGRLVFLTLSLALVYSSSAVVIEQVHAAFGESASTSFVVVFSTQNTSIVPTLRVNGLLFNGTSHNFTEGTHSQWLHEVTATGLKPATKYTYQVGDASLGVWSSVFNFTTDGATPSAKFIVYGDLGFKNAQSVPRITSEIATGTYSAVLHVGDFAYDMYDDEGRVGDSYFRMVEPFAANTAYLACPGNHENHADFAEYRARFAMPGGHDSIYSSFDIGPAHIIMWSTEILFYGWDKPVRELERIVEQYEWLRDDLKKAVAARAQRPWIFTLAHRPAYCSNSNKDDCTHGMFSVTRLYSETLFAKYGVDMEFWAHEHSYERTWPVLHGQVHNGTQGAYHNPGAPVHIVTGSAGCQEDHDRFKARNASWSAFRNDDYGFTRLSVLNNTHTVLEQVSDDRAGLIVDTMTLVKDTHPAYSNDDSEPLLIKRARHALATRDPILIETLARELSLDNEKK